MELLEGRLKEIYGGAGLRVDWDSYTRVVEEFRRELEWAREFRRRRADWSYIESRPEPLRTALKVLVETGDLKGVSRAYSIPLEALNEERIRARIPLVVLAASPAGSEGSSRLPSPG